MLLFLGMVMGEVNVRQAEANQSRATHYKESTKTPYHSNDSM